MWAKQHEKIRFGAFCKAAMYHSRFLMDRLQKQHEQKQQTGLNISPAGHKDEAQPETAADAKQEPPSDATSSVSQSGQPVDSPDEGNKKQRPKNMPSALNYPALGERLAQMWVMMPLEYKQKLMLPNPASVNKT